MIEKQPSDTSGIFPRCDYVPMWSSSESRCRNLALVRVLRSHGAGVSPVYKERCLYHAAAELGPNIIAFRHPDDGTWRPTD